MGWREGGRPVAKVKAGKSSGVKIVRSKVASAAKRTVVRSATSRVRTSSSAMKAIRK
jgi:hypothetical protein